MRVERADEVETKAETARVFVAQSSGRVLLAAVAAIAGLRLTLGSFTAADLVVIAVTVALVGPFEWLVHRFLLHAPFDSTRMTTFGVGRGHVEHHKDPAELRWLMLCWHETGIFTLALGLLSGAWAIPVAQLLETSTLATFTTAWGAASLGLIHYEWTHLLVHTRYRCRTRYYASLAKHHRLHHYRNEHYWFGVTTRSGDRLLRTMPARGAVEPSPTARSLA